jgi:hypothetical protein
MDQPAITIYCDDASHPAKRPRVFVAEYVKPDVGQANWLVVEQRRRTPRTTPPRVEWRGTPNDQGEFPFSAKQNPQCRWCKKPLDVRLGKFDAVMDALHHAGRVYVTMAELRALLGASGKRRP